MAMMSIMDKVNAGLNLIFEQTSEVVTWTNNIGWSESDGAYNQLNYLWNPQPTKSGNAINGRVALAISAFYDAVRMIAEDIAKLELEIFTRDSSGNKIKVNTGHPLYRVISMSPDGTHTAQQFWETLLAHCLVWGNGYAIIDRDPANGLIRSLELVHPNRVTIRKQNGIVTYIVTIDSQDDPPNLPNSTMEFSEAQMFRLRGVGDEDSAWPIANFARESLGITLATQSLQSNMFSNGMNIGGVLQTTQILEPEHKQGIEREWTAKYGGVNNFGKTAVLDADLSYTPNTALKATDAELLDTRKFQIEEIARWFRIPLHKLGILESNATFNNIEQENLKYISETLAPWMKRITFQIQMKLLRFSPRFFVEYDIKPLTVTTLEDRAEAWGKLIDRGMATPNDGASDMGLKTYSEGNKHYISNNVQPVDQMNVNLNIKKQELDNMANTDTADSEPAPATSEQNINQESTPHKKQEAISTQIENNSSIDITANTDSSPVLSLSDPLNDILGRYQMLMTSSLQLVVNREITHYSEQESLKSKLGDKYDASKTADKQQRFINKIALNYKEILEPFMIDMDMAIPENYISKWLQYNGVDGWELSKAQLMANDIIKHYLKLDNMPIGVYELKNKLGNITYIQIDDKGVASECKQ